MRRFWLFRSNLKNLEYYHEFKDLDIFEKKCHDFYLLFPIWLLKNNYFDEVVIWRLTDTPKDDIVFDINGKKYYQRWVSDFSETSKFPKPTVSLWRGGFKEYDKVVNKYDFGTTLYLGTGKRTYPQYGGKYDIILQEDSKDFRNSFRCLPFYKTASPYIFIERKGTPVDITWDICWPCNFSQITQKGQEQFISSISRIPYLQTLDIVHCGNKPEVGKKLCEKYGVKNIEFLGWKSREELCNVLNSSLFGLCMSNRRDGCPRVATEILMTKTPMIISEQTRLLPLYKYRGVIEVNANNLEQEIRRGIYYFSKLKYEISYAVDNIISFEKICEKNISIWKKNIKI